MNSSRVFDEEMELMPEEKLAELRLKKLQKQLDYVYKSSEFYKKKFDDAGCNPKDIKDIETFRKLPIFLTKEEHRANQEESMQKYGHRLGTFVCAPMSELALASATSGTTGPPTYYLFTKKDLDNQAKLAARQMWRTGLRPGDVVLLATAASGLYLAGVPYMYYGLVNRLYTLIPLGAEAGTKKLLEIAQATNTTALIATPSYMEYLIEATPAAIGKPISDLGIHTLIGIGEPGAGLPEVRNKLSENYNAKVYDIMGPGMDFCTVSCDADSYQGMHIVSADYVIYEDIVDPDTKEPLEIKNGVIGEVVRTVLDREAGPFIRYSMGDIIQLLTKPCPCGLPGHRVKVIGRVDDMLIVKGVNVFPGGIKDVIDSFVPKVTGAFRIVLTEPPPRVVPPLKMKIEYGSEILGHQVDELRKELEQEMHLAIRLRPEIEMIPPQTLERTHKKSDLFEKLYKK